MTGADELYERLLRLYWNWVKTMPEHQGVDVQHPRIVEYTKNMIKQGLPREEIMKRVGMPSEVIEKIERDVRKESK